MPPKKRSAAKSSEFKPWEIGRRTGKNIRAGKVIRVDKNGFENFDDYFSGNISGSDSSINITLDQTLHTNKTLPQTASDDTQTNGKKLAKTKAQKASNKGDQSIRMVRDIGRRTLKPIRLGKNIRKDEKGFEVFDDYFTDHELSSSTICLSVNQSSLIDSDDNEISFGKKDDSKTENLLLRREVIVEDEKENHEVFGDDEDNEGDSTGQYDSAPESPPSSGESHHDNNKSSRRGDKSLNKSRNKTLNLSQDCGDSESNLTEGFSPDVTSGNHTVTSGNHNNTNSNHTVTNDNSASETGSFSQSLGFSAKKTDDITFNKDCSRRRSSRNRSSINSQRNTTLNKSRGTKLSETNSFQWENTSRSNDKSSTETEQKLPETENEEEDLSENERNKDEGVKNVTEEEIVESEEEVVVSEEKDANEDLECSQDGDWETIDVEERREYLRRNNSEYLTNIVETAHEFSCSLKDDGSGEEGEKTRIRSTSHYDPSKLSQTLTAMVSFLPGRDETCEEDEVRFTDNNDDVIVTKIVNQTLTTREDSSLNLSKSNKQNKSSNKSKNESMLNKCSGKNSTQNESGKSINRSHLNKSSKSNSTQNEFGNKSKNESILNKSSRRNSSQNKSGKKSLNNNSRVEDDFDASVEDGTTESADVNQEDLVNNGGEGEEISIPENRKEDPKEDRMSGINVAGGITGSITKNNDNQKNSPQTFRTKKRLSYSGMEETLHENINLSKRERKSQKSLLATVDEHHPLDTSVKGNNSQVDVNNDLEPSEKSRIIRNAGKRSSVSRNKSIVDKTNLETGETTTGSDFEKTSSDVTNNKSANKSRRNSKNRNSTLNSSKNRTMNNLEDDVEMCENGLDDVSTAVNEASLSQQNKSRGQSRNKSLNKSGLTKAKLDIVSGTSSAEEQSDSNKNLHKTVDKNTSTSGLPNGSSVKNRKITKEIETNTTPLELHERQTAENRKRQSNDSEVFEKLKRRSDECENQADMSDDSVVKPKNRRRTVVIDDHSISNVEQDSVVIGNVQSSSSDDVIIHDGLDVEDDEPVNIAESTRIDGNRIPIETPKSGISFRTRRVRSINSKSLVRTLHRTAVEKSRLVEQTQGQELEPSSIVENNSLLVPIIDGAMSPPTIISNDDTPRELTPCLVQPGSLSAQKRNPRRVTIAEGEDSETEDVKDNETFSDLTESIHHYHDVTNDHHSPLLFKKPEKKQIIYPEPAPDGLRRSSRVRVQRLEGYKNERIIYDRRRKSGVHVLAIQPSNEAKYLAHSEKLRKARLKRIRVKKAKQKRQRYGRNLSIHGSIPDDLNLTFGTQLPIVHPDTQKEVLMTCISQQDSYVFIGPSGNVPKASDPYVMCQSLNQKSFTSGELNLRPHGEKPLQKVVNNTLVVRVIFGKVAVTIHRKVSVLETGDVFFVPTGAVYKLKNLRNEEAKLFYINIVQVEDSESERETESEHSSEHETIH